MAIGSLTTTSLGGCTPLGSAQGGQSGRRALNCPPSRIGVGGPRSAGPPRAVLLRCGMPPSRLVRRPGGAASVRRCESDDHQRLGRGELDHACLGPCPLPSELCAAGMLNAEISVRWRKGYRQLPTFMAALARHLEAVPAACDAAPVA
jgi:hypothetical protein